MLCDYRLTLLFPALNDFMNSNSEPASRMASILHTEPFPSSTLNVVKRLEDIDSALLSEKLNPGKSRKL